MKHDISPTRDPSLFNNKGMKVGALILTHEVSKRTGKLMPFKIHKVRLNKSERRAEKKERVRLMYIAFREERTQRSIQSMNITASAYILRGDNESLRSFRDRCKERWTREDRA